ncbi:MAG: ABC transporter ATP-binding protein [Nitrososphaerota archaeon]
MSKINLWNYYDLTINYAKMIDNMEKEIVKVFNLTKTYEIGKSSKRAVDNLALSIKKGEVFGLIGPNGAGKTTTIKLLLGFLRKDHGEISIFGVENTNHKIKSRIGYLPENLAFPHYLNGREFLEYMGLLHKIEPEILKDRIKKLSEMLDLTGYINRRISTYSKGMIQRLFLAQAFINNPDFLILDEPTTGLDPLGIIELRNIIQNLKRNGKTILISSHNLTELEKICDTVCFLKEGKIQEIIKMSSIKDSKEVEIFLSEIKNGILEELKENNYRFRVQDKTIIFKIEDDREIPLILRKIDNFKVKINSIITKQQTLEELFIKFVKEN